MAKQNITLSIPIYNLEISDDIGGMIEVERVKFVSATKIPRVRKRLNIPYRISELNKEFKVRQLVFDKAKTYAFLSTNNPKDPNLFYENALIREAVWLLRSSQFAREKRTNESSFGLPEHSISLYGEEYVFEVENEKANWRSLLESPLRPYTLNQTWKRYLTHHFFLPLLKILNKEVHIKMKSEWKQALRKAAMLAGKSHYSSELPEAFLYNVIAIETLLNSGERDQKISRALYQRLFALFGWMSNDNPKHLKSIVECIYRLRCDLVHHGEYKNITVEDLVNTDEILSNLLYNICSNLKYFSGRERIIRLSDEIEARRVLGLKPKRPKTLRYLSLSSRRKSSEIEKLRQSRKW